MAIKHLIVSDHQKQEIYQTKIKLSEFYFKFYLNTF
jgi:hypothetical protein